jgi:hypothetical protein
MQMAMLPSLTATVSEKMVALHLDCQLPLRMRLDEAYTLRYPRVCTLRMLPVDEAVAQKLRQIRDQLADAYGFRATAHATYEFHVTLAYQLSPFSKEERASYRSILSSAAYRKRGSNRRVGRS